MGVLRAELPCIKEYSIVVQILQSVNRPITALTAIHQNYGDLVLARFFNQKLLFVCVPNHIEEVYEQEARGLLNRDFLYEAKKSLFGDGLVNSKAELWRQQRRLIQPLFTKDAIGQWENVFIDEAQCLKDKLKASKTDEINISYQLKRLIQKIFIQVLLGKSVDTIPDSEELIGAIESISNGLLPQLVTQIISNGKLMWLMPNKSRKYHAAVNRLSNFISQEIALNQQSVNPSLISLMGQAYDKKTGYSMTQTLLKDEAINLFFAGQDTTLNILSWFFYLIGRNQAIHIKVSDEIKRYKDQPLSAAGLEKMRYTKAVLYETLRLYPPTAALSTKSVEEIVIAGQNIKKGTTIITSMRVTHRHPELWEKPNEFHPERFLNSQAESERHKYAFFPFGGGLHNCIGRHFAELEMMIIIVTLLREFSFKTTDDIKEASSITIKPDKDIIVSITSSSDNN